MISIYEKQVCLSYNLKSFHILQERQGGEVSEAAHTPHSLDPSPLCLIDTLWNHRYETGLSVYVKA